MIAVLLAASLAAPPSWTPNLEDSRQRVLAALVEELQRSQESLRLRGHEAPYFLSYDTPTSPGTSNLLEVPLSAALNRALPKRLQYLYARAPRNYTTKRVLRKLGVARMRWLRP